MFSVFLEIYHASFYTIQYTDIYIYIYRIINHTCAHLLDLLWLLDDPCVFSVA